MIVSGRMKAYDPAGCGLSLVLDTPIDREIVRKHPERVEIRIWDGREISPDQRRKIFALVREIAEWAGYDPEYTRALLLWDYCEQSGEEPFSLSDVDMSTARDFIDWIIKFCIQQGIPTRFPLSEYAEDIGRYVYACMAAKKCVCCGIKADLHHVDRVGMGRDREEILHKGMKALPLCRKHHTECHTMPQTEFERKYNLVPVKLDDVLCDIWGLKG